ncbi:hypothetical protein J3R83DRAFT_11785 [Lanmaoa asiatica]|nr:hypothetical protein J3R83DRAFT_11785 [Lanmaoa asiatica]
MPSQSFYSTLLILGASDSLSWTVTPWQALMNIYGPLWVTNLDTPADTISPNNPEWTVKIAQAMKIFADNVWSKECDEQDVYVVKRQADNDSSGRTTWKDWVFISLNWSLYDVMAIHRKRKLPSLEDSQLSEVKVALADRFFSKHAFLNGSDILLTEVCKFIDGLIVITWNQYWKGNTRQTNRLDKDQNKIREIWTAITANGAQPKASEISKFLTHIRHMTLILEKYKDNDTKEELNGYARCLEGILAAI